MKTKENEFLIGATIMAIILMILFGFLFYDLLRQQFSDLFAHLSQADKITKGKADYPPNFGLYAIINLGSTWMQKMTIMAFVMGSSVALKFWVTAKILHNEHNKKIGLALLFAFGLLFIFAIPSFTFFLRKNLYFGNFVPTTWHNSTTIMVMPFALMLFYYAFVRQKAVSLFLLTGLIVINTIIKPSFIIITIPVLFTIVAYNLIKFGNSDKKQLAALVICTVLIIMQSVLIYYINLGSFQRDESSIAVRPLAAYRQFSPVLNLPVALATSYLFPLIFTFFNRKQLSKNIILAWLYVIFSLILFLTVIETGPRQTHGNFYWQIIPSSYILMLFCSSELWKKWNTGSRSSNYASLSALLLHIIAGAFYFVNVFWSHNNF